MLILLFLLAVYGDECDGNGVCESIEKAHVESLYVDELFLDCHQVPPFDGDPCTNEDIVDGQVVKVHIPGCCFDDTDCEPFRPDSCYVSTCLIRDGDTHGTCVHSRTALCCNDVSDCPKQKCMDYVCDENCPQGELFFTPHASGQHHQAWSKRSVSLNTQCKQCVGTQRPNCCLTSADCDFGGRLANCTQHEIGVCDGNHECVCIPNKGEECTHQTEDVDCAYLQPKLERCPNECAAIHCVKGHCTIEIDPFTDFDGDGFNCTGDCDDRNSTVHAFVWCASTEGRNDDNDAFVKCGTDVYRRCGACNAGEVEVPADSFDCSAENLPDGPCMLTRECDCCDNHASNERPDHVICCHADCDADDGGVLECGGDARQVCFTKPANEETTMDAECQAWGATTEKSPGCDCEERDGLDCTNCWHAAADQPCPAPCDAEPLGVCGGGDDPLVQASPGARLQSKRGCKKKRQPTICDQCPNSPATTADKTCFLDCDGDDQPVCPTDTGSALECCTNLADRKPTSYDHVKPEIKTCCEAIIKESNADTATDANNLFPADGDASTFAATAPFCNHESTPYIPNQCVCVEGYIDSSRFNATTHTDYCDCTTEDIHDDYIYSCGVDNDHDCVVDCEPVRRCVSTDPREHAADVICAAEGLLVPPTDDGTCDCNDDDATVAQYHGCFPDLDGDSFINCTSCTSVCGDCPAGYHPLTLPPPAPGPQGNRVPRVRSPLGHKNQKRIVQCPTLAEYITCPCSEPIPAGEQCQDEHPIPPLGQQCDCCDRDPYAYPGSRWCSTKPRVCPDEDGHDSFDYNCDDDDDHLVLCEDTDEEDELDWDDIVHDTQDGRDRYVRGCQAANNSDTNANNVFIESTVLGECGYNSSSGNCSTHHGFCLERKRNAGERIILSKRAMGDGGLTMHAPIECNDGSITDPEDYLPNSPPEGACVEYIQECHQRHHTHTSCTCDCDICVIVGQ